MIKTFIFDCGNVLIGFDIPSLLKAYIPDSEEDRELVKNILWPAWSKQDEGMPSVEFSKEIKPLVPEHLKRAVHNLIYHWKEKTYPIKGMEDLIKELKSKGYRLILLSNMPDTFTYDHDDVTVLEYFDDLIFSFPLKMKKPEKGIYEYMIKKHKLKVNECLFTDDSEDNINTAKELGLNTFLFNPNNPKELITYIKGIIDSQG